MSPVLESGHLFATVCENRTVQAVPILPPFSLFSGSRDGGRDRAECFPLVGGLLENVPSVRGLSPELFPVCSRIVLIILLLLGAYKVIRAEWPAADAHPRPPSIEQQR